MRQEPRLLLEIRDQDEANYFDTEMEVYYFLKEQYQYEKSRVPIHNSFQDNYRLSFFSVSEMLNYYMNPLKNKKLRYKYDELNYPHTISKIKIEH